MDTVGTGLLSIVYREVVPISEVKPCMLQLVGGNQIELQTTQAAVSIKPLTYVKLLKYINRITMVISDLILISSDENLSYCTTYMQSC